MALFKKPKPEPKIVADFTPLTPWQALHPDPEMRDKSVAELERLYNRGTRADGVRAAAELGFRHMSKNKASRRGARLSYKKALKYNTYAADFNNARVQNNLGGMYAEGLGVKADNTKAITYFQQAANNGLAVAWYNLAFVQVRENVNANVAPLLEKAVAGGYLPALLLLSDLCFVGKNGAVQDLEQALRYAKQADAHHIAEAPWQIRHILQAQDKLTDALFMELLLRGARLGDARAQISVAAGLFYGNRYLLENKAQARVYAKAAAEVGVIEAQYFWGILLLDDGVENHDDEAIIAGEAWLEKAAKRKFAPALLVLAKMQCSAAPKAAMSLVADAIKAAVVAPDSFVWYQRCDSVAAFITKCEKVLTEAAASYDFQQKVKAATPDILVAAEQMYAASKAGNNT